VSPRHAGTRLPHPARARGGSAVYDHLARALDGHDDAWMAHAACGGRGDDLFYPSGYLKTAAQVEEARAVCAGCPVVGACRQWALEVPEPHGIWGATTPSERRTLRRRGVAR